MCQTFIIVSFVDGYLGCFLVLAIVNCTVINMGIQVLLLYEDFIFFEYILRSGISGLNGRSISVSKKSPYCIFIVCIPMNNGVGYLFPPDVGHSYQS